ASHHDAAVTRDGVCLTRASAERAQAADPRRIPPGREQISFVVGTRSDDDIAIVRTALGITGLNALQSAEILHHTVRAPAKRARRKIALQRLADHRDAGSAYRQGFAVETTGQEPEVGHDTGAPPERVVSVLGEEVADDDGAIPRDVGGNRVRARYVGEFLHSPSGRPHERSQEPADRPRPADDLGSVVRNRQGLHFGSLWIQRPEIAEDPRLPPEAALVKDPRVRDPVGPNDDVAARRHVPGEALYAARSEAERLEAG